MVGIIADSHDHVPMIQRACEVFNRHAVAVVFHAGDYIAPFSLNPLNELLTCEYRGVFGNNDGEQRGLQKTAAKRLCASPAENRLCASPAVFTVEEWQILVAHDLPAPAEAAADHRYRLIVYGHTHRPEVKRLGDTLLVNPGECGGWLFGRSTVAVADLGALSAEIIDL
jgi:putative phosphoesterase